MKVVSNEALTKLIQLVKSSFIKVDDIVQTQEVTLADVATSGDYDDLSNKPTIPTVNNATLTIQKNGSNVATFTANASSNVTANIEVPTVDQAYSASSTNAQSGVAVASAISTKADSSTVSNINSRVTTIEGDIPTQASSSNQLADKNFVNSSIATNTATFIGTFNSVAELEAYSGAKDDNDYAFVVSTDAAGNTVYNRYKWNGTAWLFEYALNNSSFTANQWAAINSGATTANIGQIATKADDNAVVHKTGTETIGGNKTFTNDIITDNILPKGYITLGTSTNTWGKMVQFQDTTGKRIARIQPMAIDTTDNRVGMWVNNADNSVEKGIFIESNGTTYAPTPSVSDNSTKIATTAFVGKAVSNVLSTLYPVGAIYIGTQSTCPLATLISGSTWVKVSEGRVLQGSDSGHAAGTTIEAGLPNIMGTIASRSSSSLSSGCVVAGSGCFSYSAKSGVDGYNAISTTSSTVKLDKTSFSASDYNSIYGNSTTVQPPAYCVNIWRRTA